MTVSFFLTKNPKFLYFLCSVSEIFPPVSLNFAGGASMMLKPEDYLLQQNSIVSCWSLLLSKIETGSLLWDLVHRLCLKKETGLLICDVWKKNNGQICLFTEFVNFQWCNFEWANLCFAGWCCSVVHWLSKDPRSRDYNFRRYEHAGRSLRVMLYMGPEIGSHVHCKVVQWTKVQYCNALGMHSIFLELNTK